MNKWETGSLAGSAIEGKVYLWWVHLWDSPTSTNQRLHVTTCCCCCLFCIYIEERRDLSLVMGEIPKEELPHSVTNTRPFDFHLAQQPKNKEKIKFVVICLLCGRDGQIHWAAIILSPFTFFFFSRAPPFEFDLFYRTSLENHEI